MGHGSQRLRSLDDCDLVLSSLAWLSRKGVIGANGRSGWGRGFTSVFGTPKFIRIKSRGSDGLGHDGFAGCRLRFTDFQRGQ